MTCHQVDEGRIEQALQSIWVRTVHRWHPLRHDSLHLRGLRELRDELLDHVAARTLDDPLHGMHPPLTVLITAAECALGELSLGAFPDGDFEIPLPLIDETLSSESVSFDESQDPAHRAATARTWLDAFALSVISGVIWERSRVIGPLLQVDYAPAIRNGVPYSRYESTSDPADLAEMDALCDYLNVMTGPRPGAVPGPVPLRKPEPEERERAARRLDEAGASTPDQRLLRVLLDDDQESFEEALADRLAEHRENAGPDAHPRSLLPLGPLTLAALASLAHGWQPGVRSRYLPEAVLRVPQQYAAPDV
ncbi:immunity 49 family protein [Streptomyces aurantiogriseus]|uniref:immunity 49 family protein n=1 Tax=Streptomyces aurantiogriseus TaxID=66870 RepID=UPI001E521A57|nr:immunity 49 family protein [Streptomyces aurantiogriseus]